MLYKHFIGDKDNGVFIDVGAFDGEQYSNTCRLADKGWRGIMIEPVSGSYDKCVKRHKDNDVEVMNCALGNRRGKGVINVHGVISTISEEAKDRFKTLGWWRGDKTQEIEIETLNAIFDKEGDVDVLDIDVEGYEWEILRGFDIALYKPKMVIIELHDNNLNYDEGDSMKIVRYFDDHGYRVVWKDLTNTIYIL